MLRFTVIAQCRCGVVTFAEVIVQPPVKTANFLGHFEPVISDGCSTREVPESRENWRALEELNKHAGVIEKCHKEN